MRRPTSSGSPQRAQEQARRGEESGEDRQEKDGHPHLPASRRPPSGPNGGPRPQQDTCDVEGTDAVQLPHSPQKLDTLGLRCHAQPCTPSHQRTPRAGEAHARTPHRKIPAPAPCCNATRSMQRRHPFWAHPDPTPPREATRMVIHKRLPHPTLPTSAQPQAPSGADHRDGTVQTYRTGSRPPLVPTTHTPQVGHQNTDTPKRPTRATPTLEGTSSQAPVLDHPNHLPCPRPSSPCIWPAQREDGKGSSSACPHNRGRLTCGRLLHRRRHRPAPARSRLHRPHHRPHLLLPPAAGRRGPHTAPLLAVREVTRRR